MKLVRPSHPAESNVLFLSYIFFIASFFSFQLFNVSFEGLHHWKNEYFGMLLIGAATSIMVMIVWEEMIFPIKAKKVEGGFIFMNHRTKLKTQILLYSAIPGIFVFIYLVFEVNIFHFSIWAAIGLVPPIVEKIVSGVKNYNDYLKLTDHGIEYKNNEKEGSFETKDVQNIEMIEDEGKMSKKILLLFKERDKVIIDLHEMELEAFYESIDKFIAMHYGHLLKGTNAMGIA